LLLVSSFGESLIFPTEKRKKESCVLGVWVLFIWILWKCTLFGLDPFLSKVPRCLVHCLLTMTCTCIQVELILKILCVYNPACVRMFSDISSLLTSFFLVYIISSCYSFLFLFMPISVFLSHYYSCFSTLVQLWTFVYILSRFNENSETANNGRVYTLLSTLVVLASRLCTQPVFGLQWG
jgi:hypothetical protein